MPGALWQRGRQAWRCNVLSRNPRHSRGDGNPVENKLLIKRQAMGTTAVFPATPAKQCRASANMFHWIPAFAGMTGGIGKPPLTGGVWYRHPQFCQRNSEHLQFPRKREPGFVSA